MSFRWKETNAYKKLRQVKVNRAVYLSSVILLLSLAVVLAITAASNRAKKNRAALNEPDGQPTVLTPGTEDTPVVLTPDDGQTDAPAVNTDAVPEFVLPVGGKLVQAHDADVQVFSRTMNDYRVHLGIDILTAENTPVCAAADGAVAKIWEDPMMGQCVAISHSGSCVTVYKNLSPELAAGIAEGAPVMRGQTIGSVGNSALAEIAEEPHLHMEMTVKGLQVDPLDYFSAAVISGLAEDTSFEDTEGSK